MKSNFAVGLAFVLGTLFSCDNKSSNASDAVEHPKQITGCAKERRMHAYGTYRAVYGHDGAFEHDLPIDLTIEECLEWK